MDWTRIPTPIDQEADRRTLCAVLASYGLEVRVVKIRITKSGSIKRFIEYRGNHPVEPKTT